MSKASTIKKPPNLVHESEVQRQHVRVRIPAAIRIGKNTYRIKDLSAGGVSVRTDKNFLAASEEREGTILFPFENFSFNLKMNLQPVYSRPEKKLTGFRFDDVTPRQVSMLRHIIQSYLSGVIASEEDIIAIAARDNFTNLKDDEMLDDMPERGFLSRIGPLLAIGAAGILGLFLLLGNIYENTAIVKSYVGIVEGNTFTARASDNGSFYSLLAKGTEQVAKGQPLAVIKVKAEIASPAASTSTQNITIASPCDCLIVKQFPQDGEFIAMGEPVYKLQPVNDYLWVTAKLEPMQVHRLSLQDHARIKIAGESEFIEGNITEFITPSPDKDLTQVRIRTKKAIPPTLAGRLAYVEFTLN